MTSCKAFVSGLKALKQNILSSYPFIHNCCCQVNDKAVVELTNDIRGLLTENLQRQDLSSLHPDHFVVRVRLPLLAPVRPPVHRAGHRGHDDHAG